jgi:CRP/FNR family cyclic AMP-dependent transcriptional regulator
MILLVGNRDDVHKIVPDMLRLAGYEVVVVPDGVSALRLVDEKIPALVICDAELPDPGVYVLLRELRRRESQLPVIVVGGLSGKEDIRKVMTAGADDCLSAPFETIDLLRSVEACLTRRGRLCHRVERPVEESFDEHEFLNAYGDRDIVQMKRKQLLYFEGQRALCVWLVMSGRVKSYRINEEGKELITSIYGKGQLIGCPEVMESACYRDNARVLEDAGLVAIPRQEFLETLQGSPKMTHWLLQTMAHRSALRDRGLVNLSYNSLRKRVADGLLELAAYYKEAGQDGSIVISRENLAGIVGAAPESLTRTLSDFRKEKLISIQEGRIVLLDEEGLRDMIN